MTDTGGTGIPVLYLNGQFSTQGYWRRVIAELGSGWRHITFDGRARGRRSRTSADYSFAAALRDVDAALAARGVEQARIRESLDAAIARNPQIGLSAKVDSDHGAILRKDSAAVAEAVREVAALSPACR